MPFPWGAAMMAGGQMLGGIVNNLFGGEQDNYHPEVWRNDAYKNYMKSIQGIRDASAKFGIHPLALLGSGGSGGGFAAPVPDSFSGGSGIGDAIGEGLSTFGSLYAEHQLGEDREEERKRVEYLNMRDRALANLRPKEITPEVRLQRENMRLQNEGLSLENAISRSRLAKAGAEAVGATQGTVLTPMANEIKLPMSTDAATMQNEFGEVVGDTYGWLRWLESQLTDPRTGEGLGRKYLRENMKLPTDPRRPGTY